MTPDEIATKVRILKMRKKARAIAEREARAAASQRLVRRAPMTQCRAHRRDRGLSQTDLAKLCEIHQSQVSDIECLVPGIKHYVLDAVAKYLKLPISELQLPVGLIEVPVDADPMDSSPPIKKE